MPKFLWGWGKGGCIEAAKLCTCQILPKCDSEIVLYMYVPCEPFESDTSVGRVFVDSPIEIIRAGKTTIFHMLRDNPLIVVIFDRPKYTR